MSRVVVLKLTGDLEQQGFQVSLDITQDGQYPLLSEDGMLPANPELAQHLAQWQQSYGEWLQPQPAGTHRGIKPYKIQYDGTLQSLDNCRDAAQQLTRSFHQWLRSPSFLNLERHLCRLLAIDDVIRVLIRSSSPQIHALPWHLWSFVEDYPNAEIAMGARRFQQVLDESVPPAKTSRVSILAVLGDRTNIDIDTDRQLLNQLPRADVELLVEPSLPQLHDQLYTRSWDILFFAGHSDTLAEGDGILQLNPTTALTIEDLKYGVKKAIANGLQLAIFNSCSGVGLAHALAELQLPQMIVMRQAIPDHVAHTFLKYFLDAFAQGTSLYQAERQARERLQSLEQEFPCASWLPMIYQHPAKVPPTWRSLQTPTAFLPPPRAANVKTFSRKEKLTRLTAVSFMLTSLVMGIRLLGFLQPLEFWTFNQLMPLRPPDPVDPRLLLITLSETDLTYQDDQGYDRDGSLSNEALHDLLQRLQPHNPAVIGVDIFRENPVMPNSVLATVDADQTTPDRDLNEPYANTIFICTSKARSRPDPAIPPPPDIPLAQVGFNNAVVDPDHHVRRLLIAMSATQGCETEFSLSYQLARWHLYRVYGISADRDGQGNLVIGDTRFPRLLPHHGPYHRVDMGGYATLLNYRAGNSFERLSLEAILSGAVKAEELEELVRDRVILIGTTAYSFHDFHLTPYGEMAGVELHAHMVSQLLSAVLDDRPLLRVWPQWGDGLWILVWSGFSGVLAVYFHRRFQLIVAAAVTLSGLCVVCLLFLQTGLWLPLVPTIISCIAVMTVLQHQQLIPIPWLDQRPK
ncbi:MAG: CHASE2 domain-containing protein [Leptolyngbyaceae cyanobacterium]